MNSTVSFCVAMVAESKSAMLIDSGCGYSGLTNGVRTRAVSVSHSSK